MWRCHWYRVFLWQHFPSEDITHGMLEILLYKHRGRIVLCHFASRDALLAQECVQKTRHLLTFFSNYAYESSNRTKQEKSTKTLKCMQIDCSSTSTPNLSKIGKLSLASANLANTLCRKWSAAGETKLGASIDSIWWSTWLSVRHDLLAVLISFWDWNLIW